MASDAGDGDHLPHFFFFPAMAAGHTLPMVDLAKLFADRGARATLVLTPAAAAAVHTAGHPLAVELIHFPSSDAGLPATCQSMDQAANREEAGKFLAGLRLLEPGFRRLVDRHRPDCVVSDMFLPWTADVSESFGVPRVIFTGSSCFSYCANFAVRKLSPQAAVASDDEPFVIPGLPDEICMTRAKLPNESASPNLHELFKMVEAAQAKTYGLVMNSFHELESDYIKHLQTSMGTKTWPVGPVSLCNRSKSEVKERGLRQSSSSSPSDVQAWLDTKKPRSVLYICFGSTCTSTAKQMEETAAALESMELLAFIWVVKESEALPQGFEEKAGKERGLVIRGWAPQMLILGHGAVGGFVTHCGWNSVLEGLTCGLPMVTWPAFAEQFYNEKMVTELLRVGVGVGVGRWSRWEVGEEREVVGKGRIVEAVQRVMGGGEESEGMRRRAAAVAAAAEAAVAVGGSSYVELGRLIEEVKSMKDSTRKVAA